MPGNQIRRGIDCLRVSRSLTDPLTDNQAKEIALVFTYINTIKALGRSSTALAAGELYFVQVRSSVAEGLKLRVHHDVISIHPVAVDEPAVGCF